MEIDFYKIRSLSKGETDGFEELCCQLFYREFNDDKNEYLRFRGDGGDGGVEALFVYKNRSKIALQSKYWKDRKFGTSQITQLTKSIDAAKSNHPEIQKYYITIPFNLTGKVSSGSRGKSQSEKFNKWKDIKEKEHSLEIVLLSETLLADLLIKHDETGGLRRYWFDDTILTETQYRQHIEDVVAQAGKRYTPKLSVKVPLLKALDSFIRPAVILNEIKELTSLYNDRVSRYSFKDVIKEHFNETDDNLSKIIESLEKFNKAGNNFGRYQNELSDLLDSVLEKLLTVEMILFNKLKSEHGDDFFDTPGFRQFHAEYMCDFPAGKLDATREVIGVVEKIQSWIQNSNVKLNYHKQMLIRGVAGIGKTHSIIDYVQEQQRQGLWVFFGEDFNETEPWKIIADKLGLSSTISRYELFEILSTQAIAEDKTGVLFIDALNETNNRKSWKKWLPVLAKQVLRFPSLKLCVTCRDTYLDEVFCNRKEWVEFTHNGFLGQEYKAIQEFFDFYQLKPPVTPLLQTEFRNPLFLHLVCDSLHGCGYDEIPRGRLGFQDMMSICLNHKNILVSERCNCDPHIQIVHKALSRMAVIMSETKTRHLEYTKAKAIADELHPPMGFDSSLLNQLEKEGLISFFDRKERPYDTPTKYCRFTFERIADFFIATNVFEIYSTSEKIGALLSSEWVVENKGVIEAIAMILPESESPSEILDHGDDSYIEDIAMAFIDSLQWRDSEKITVSTQRWLEHTSKIKGEFITNIFNAVISISLIPDNLLNAYFLDELLQRHNLCMRDSYWNYHLIEDYEKNAAAWTLIEWSCFSDVSNYSKDSLLLWSITLSWFTACSDRRIRDRSSKGLTRVLCANVTNCDTLLSHFVYSDDDYVFERVTSAIYAALLLNPDMSIISNLSKMIVSNSYLERFDNVIIHDNLRLIVELAFTLDTNLSKEIDLEAIRKSSSGNKFTVFNESTSSAILENDAFSNSNIDMLSHGRLGTDFKRYILDNCVDIFDLDKAKISKEDIYRWFIVELKNLGYPGRDEACWRFDRYLMGRHGNGRAKPKWAERLGKKYYWILLNRLLGQLRNTASLKPPRYADEKNPKHTRLLSLGVRKIDLTDLRYVKNENSGEIDLPLISINSESAPSKWITNKRDFCNIPYIIQDIEDNSGTSWIPLIYYDSNKESPPDQEYPYREKAVQFSSLVISKDDLNSDKSVKKEDGFIANIFDHTVNNYTVYLGEYPNSRTCDEHTETGSWPQSYRITSNISGRPTTIDLLRGVEWEYDCSFESDSFLVPSPILIQSNNLKWDKNQGWKDKAGSTVIFSSDTNNGRAVWIRKDFLKQFLGDEQILYYITYNEKMYVEDGMQAAKGLHSLRGVYIYDGSKIEMIRNITQDCDFRE